MSDVVAKDRVARAGDVQIDEVAVITSRGVLTVITPQVLGVEIFEDIFGTFITGKLFVQDLQNLTNILPLIGEEVVRFRVRTPSLPDADSYTGEYFIYKMDDRIHINDKQQAYVLHFISKDAINDMNKKVSKGFSGKISDIAQKVLTSAEGLETKRPINVEDTQNSLKYVSNFWSPSKNLTYLTESAVNATGSPSFLFFENKYGLNFVSLESLYIGTPIQQRFIVDNYTADVSKLGGSSRDIEKDYQRVLELRIGESFNYIDRIRSGMYGSEIIYMDLLTKQYVHKGYTPNFAEEKHLNKFPLWSNLTPVRPKGLLIVERQYYNNFDGVDVTSNTKIVQRRKSLLAQAEASKVVITVFGRTDYSAGQRVALDIPKAGELQRGEDPLDPLLSGIYLVAAVRHYITRDNHECTLELIKDSYTVDVNV